MLTKVNLTYPDPRLTSKVDPIALSEETRVLIGAYIICAAKVMSHHGAKGVSGPALAFPYQILTVALEINQKRTQENSEVATEIRNTLTMANPEILSISGEKVIEEGCICCPSLTVPMKRPTRLEVEFDSVWISATSKDQINIQFEREERVFLGESAGLVHHEIKHLQGSMITDELGSLKRNIYRDQCRKESEFYNFLGDPWSNIGGLIVGLRHLQEDYEKIDKIQSVLKTPGDMNLSAKALHTGGYKLLYEKFPKLGEIMEGVDPRIFILTMAQGNRKNWSTTDLKQVLAMFDTNHTRKKA